jgi:dimethylargininase
LSALGASAGPGPTRQLVALTHPPSPKLEAGERTYVGREPIDFAEAVRQHEAYRALLVKCGVRHIHTIDANRDCPDSTFIEDTAVVLDEIAVQASMGADSRRREPDGIASVLRQYRDVVPIELPATLEGGDVVTIGRTLIVGLTSRTNIAGVRALERIVERFGYRVTAVTPRGALHLKTACCSVDDETLLVNTAWIDKAELHSFRIIPIVPTEPFGAEVTRVGKTLVMAAETPRTADVLRARGHDVRTTPLSEFAKAEGGPTCLSIIFRTDGHRAGGD